MSKRGCEKKESKTQCYDYKNPPSDNAMWEIMAPTYPLQKTKSWSLCLQENAPYSIVSEKPGHYILQEEETKQTKTKNKNNIHNDKFQLTASMVDFNRMLCADDEHESGVHVNLIWMDHQNEKIYRFDPYFWKEKTDCVAMQKILDKMCKDPKMNPKGYKYEALNQKEFPIGPQVFECSAQKLDCQGTEQFCVPWCMAMLKVLLEAFLQKQPIDPTSIYGTFLKQQELTIPEIQFKGNKLAPATQKVANQYYTCIRKLLELE